MRTLVLLSLALPLATACSRSTGTDKGEPVDTGDDGGGDDGGGDDGGEPDADGDGFYASEDCDDEDASVNPEAEEVPYNGKDDDCDESTAEDDLSFSPQRR